MLELFFLGPSEVFDVMVEVLVISMLIRNGAKATLIKMRLMDVRIV